MDITVANGEGSLPIHPASGLGHFEVVKLLLEHGADVRLGHTRTESTPLHLACYGGFVDVIKLLLDRGTAIKAGAEDGSTPLHYAAFAGQVETSRLLLEHLEDGIDACDFYDRIPLFWACSMGHDDVVELLISRGSSVDAIDHYGATPFLAAVRNGKEEVVKRLLLLPAVDINSKDALGRTVIWWASKSGKRQIAQVIREKAGISDDDDDGLDLKINGLAVTKKFREKYDWLSDVCTRPFSGTESSYQCVKCARFTVDVCVECFHAGARCLESSHELALFRHDALTRMVGL